MTVSTAAVTFTSVGVNAATITVETDRIRYRIDGTAPTSTTGHEVAAGGSIELIDRGQCKNFQAIRSSAAAGDATIRVTKFSQYVPA